MKNFPSFIEKIKTINNLEEAKKILFDVSSNFNQEKIKDAMEFAILAHKGQFRKSGEEYVIHPILVASITSFFSDNEDMIISALLHDVVEDTEYEFKDIFLKFGACVSHLVEGLTKITDIRANSLIPSTKIDEKLAKSALTFRNMLISSIKDIRVLVIKLCDRLHNMLTLDALRDDKQKRISEETILVYAPIAHRLGISTLKKYLEDLSFMYLLPAEYKKIDYFLHINKENLTLKLNNFISKIEVLLSQNGLKDFEIKGRIKHYYSIYLKMQRKGISIEEVLDLLAIRIIVKDRIECYETFGAVHLNFRPLISRFKDYIAIPKENGYQTLHTSVFDETSVIEVQIRTSDMDKNAEFGIAAHWRYKLDSASPNTGWLNNLTFENEKIEDFYELAKNDLFREDIIVYSPKFDVFTLPLGATALDFAYAVHTDIGNKAKEVYINKQKSSLLTTLKNGDIIRIITDKKEIPRCSWIDALITSKAKLSAKQLCNHRIKEVENDIALNILQTIFSIEIIKLKALIKANYLCNKIYKIVEDKNFLVDVVNKLSKTIKEKEKLKLFFKSYKLKEYMFDSIRVLSDKTIHDIEFSFCCHPKRGDEIVGFLDNKKVTIHHKLCSTAVDLIKARENMVYVEWIEENSISKYLIIVNLQNKKGELAKFVSELAKLDVSIASIELGVNSDFCKVEVEIDEKKLDKISTKLKQTYHIIEFISLKDAYNRKVK